MSEISVGDVIEYHLMPGFWMPVLGTAGCDRADDEGDHEMFLVLDITGNENWLCEHDVTRIT